MAREGLSSWVARLAVHNFVTPADFWAGLDCEGVADLVLHDGLLDRLSASTRLGVGDLRRAFAPDLATKAAPLAVSQPGAIRGAACPACCRAAADRGDDHFVAAASASSWRVSCPEHGVGLVGLDGYGFVLQEGAARLVRDGTRIRLGATSLTDRPAELTLAFEHAIIGALSGRPPGTDWLPRAPATFLASAVALIEVVLWRPAGGLAFAHQFDEIRNTSPSFSIGPEDRRQGTAPLADQGPRHRMNVYAALATLLVRPAARRHPFAPLLGWNDPSYPSPFAFMFGQFDDGLRALVERRLERWPDCIATPARQALQEAR
jgi:hypothetical protein